MKESERAQWETKLAPFIGELSTTEIVTECYKFSQETIDLHWDEVCQLVYDLIAAGADPQAVYNRLKRREPL